VLSHCKGNAHFLVALVQNVGHGHIYAKECTLFGALVRNVRHGLFIRDFQSIVYTQSAYVRSSIDEAGFEDWLKKKII
jgi:hypothetical protein